ncbi:MAG: FAD-dependent oxidoreductase [Afipia sp.]|jgi:3-phenylpropionate/trans-cinnamate dioxygenase ferredoxin reductase subunit|nr:FAD-dependent oxidoreductase [Afipia sp.]MBS4002227.1 FAD-dependent oxidoreductase [Afipia sp.]WIG52075.1 MAG: Ferredoxin reductase [Afipia sp.]
MTGADSHIVIIGAGQAGLQAAETLRSEAFEGRITLLGAEPYAPYQRPPLSKSWLTDNLDADQLALRDYSVLERKQIDLWTRASVSAIDVRSQSVLLHDGRALTYTGLVLATGATPRQLPQARDAGDLVCTLRSRADSDAIAQGLRSCVRRELPLVVVGGGFIGLEVAASARKLGIAVTILEAAPRLLERVLSQDLSDWYARLHADRGTTLIFGARIAEIRKTSNHVAEVEFVDGHCIVAGLVVVGIGVTANDQLARDAGIACEAGIIVDACGRTSVPNIVAAGDCTVRRLSDGTMLRLESVQNAVEQGRSAAHALLGVDKPSLGAPWFWSDQYDMKLQIAGLSRGADTHVLRGDMESHSFSIYHFRETRLVAVDSINAARDHMIARDLIGRQISPTAQQACDTAFNLAKLRTAQA